MTVGEVQRFCFDVFTNLGVNKDFAQQTAESLIAADYRGHFSHGINRLGEYFKPFLLNLELIHYVGNVSDCILFLLIICTS